MTAQTPAYRELVSFLADGGEIDTAMELTDDQLATVVEQYSDVMTGAVASIDADSLISALRRKALGTHLAGELRTSMVGLARAKLAADVENELIERELDEDRPRGRAGHFRTLFPHFDRTSER